MARTATLDVGDSSGPPPTHLPSRPDRCVLATHLTVPGGRNRSVCVYVCVSVAFISSLEWYQIDRIGAVSVNIIFVCSI